MRSHKTIVLVGIEHPGAIATAKYFAARNFSVVLVATCEDDYSRVMEELQTLGSGKMLLLHASSSTEVMRSFTSAVDHCRRVDALVFFAKYVSSLTPGNENVCASVHSSIFVAGADTSLKVTAQGFDDLIDCNLKSCFRWLQETIKHMNSRGGGRILLVTPEISPLCVTDEIVSFGLKKLVTAFKKQIVNNEDVKIDFVDVCGDNHTVHDLSIRLFSELDLGADGKYYSQAYGHHHHSYCCQNDGSNHNIASMNNTNQNSSSNNTNNSINFNTNHSNSPCKSGCSHHNHLA